MNKTISVTLNGQLFTLEEDAYAELQNYLSVIKEHFKDNEDRDEILKDLEASISEKFLSKITAKKTVITKIDVDDLVSVLGDVSDFKNDEDLDQAKEKENDDETKFRHAKRLYRDTDDAVLGGVASGIAAYFGIDPVIVRLLFAITVFFGGVGAFIYLVLWIAVPEAKTSVQKIEMQGSEVTLKKLEEAAKEKSAVIREKVRKDGWQKIVAIPLEFLGEVLRAIFDFLKKLFPVLGAIIGIFIVFFVAIAIGSSAVAAVVAIVGKDSGFINSDVPLDMIFSTPGYYLAVLSSFFLVTIPLFFLMLLGFALIKRKKVFSVAGSSVLVGLWLIALIVITAATIEAIPRAEKAYTDLEGREVIEKELSLEGFDTISLADNYKAKIRKGEEYKVIARGTAASLDDIDYELYREGLFLEKKRHDGICFFCEKRSVEFEIISPDLDELIARNSAELEVSGFDPDTFRMDISGASKVDLNSEGERVTGAISGASWLYLTGSSTMVDLQVSGASKLNIENMDLAFLDLDLSGASKTELSGKSDKANVNCSGVSKLYASAMPINSLVMEASESSRSELEVVDEFDVDLSENAKVTYSGNPKLDHRRSGTSELKPLRDGQMNTGESQIRKLIDDAGATVNENLNQ